MCFNGISVPISGAINVSEYPKIESGDYMELTYDLQIAVQSRNINQALAKISFTVSWDGHGPLDGICVSSPPNCTEYEPGENFDTSGMVISAVYADGSTSPITGWTVTDGTSLAEGQQYVTVSYTENQNTKTVQVGVTVAKKPAYAMLYDTNGDGFGDELIFQRGNKANPNYTLIQSYTGFETASYTAISTPWFSKRFLINSIKFEGKIQPVSTAYWFHGFDSLTSISGLNNLDMSQVESMYGMFEYASNLTSLDLTGWKTPKVKSMAYLFYGCTSLSNVTLTGINTRKVESMAYMFYNCKSLTSLSIPGFNTVNVTNMAGMFKDCSALKTIGVSDAFSTAAVTDSTDMFTGCTSLVSEYGTAYDPSYTDKTYARIDEYGIKGYFTREYPVPVFGVAAYGMGNESKNKNVESQELTDITEESDASMVDAELLNDEASVVQTMISLIAPASSTDLNVSEAQGNILPASSTDIVSD